MTPSEPDLWIVVRNWDKFQHYGKRNPPWIKNYLELLHDDNYLSLSGGDRAVLHGLWLEYASSRRRLRLDTRSISARLRLRVTNATLERLNHAGFIDVVASKVLATHARSQETETETEKKEQKQKPASLAVVQYDEIETLDFDAILSRQAGSYPQAEESEEPWK